MALVGFATTEDDAADAPGPRIAHADRELLAPVDRWHPHRALVRGYDFPDHVLALTWDDGPDRETVALAHYLHREHVAGTFFVVAEWDPSISDEPGYGPSIYATGYRRLPVLGDLVRLGHRVGSHTRNHALLSRLSTAEEITQLQDNQRAIDPFVTNELRLFRAPGGAWSEESALALEDPETDASSVSLRSLVGPVHWDIDAKDWDSSLYCRQPHGPDDCEPGPVPGEPRVRASVIAARYLSQIEYRHQGIVLFHDRVGDVGSRYALDVAETLVPALVARGYVFAAPVLAFSPLRRLDGGGTTVLADIDGDGRADRCSDGDRLRCSFATFDRMDPLPHVAFDPPADLLALPPHRSIAFADVDGDHRPDVCVRTEEHIACALARIEPVARVSHADPSDRLVFGDFARFSGDLPGSDLWLADVDGDGRADACSRSGETISCALAGEHGFAPPKVWARGAVGEVALGDLDGDRRSDLCVSGPRGLACARSSGRAFGVLARWGTLDGDGLVLADLNGDGRADACAADAAVSCALSDGHAFKTATMWAGKIDAPMRLADLDGDGRADLCTLGTSLSCAMAP